MLGWHRLIFLYLANIQLEAIPGIPTEGILTSSRQPFIHHFQIHKGSRLIIGLVLLDSRRSSLLYITIST